MGKSTAFYKNATKAQIAKKRAKDKEINSRPEQRKKRAELNKANRKRKTYGNGDKIDLHHKKGGGLISEHQSKNRCRSEKSRLKGSKRMKAFMKKK